MKELLSLNELISSEDLSTLNVDELMRVEGGVDLSLLNSCNGTPMCSGTSAISITCNGTPSLTCNGSPSIR